MKPVPSDNYVFTHSAGPESTAGGRALLVAYKFPPHDVGVAHHRPEALYRHLGNHGWDCDVITAERPGTAEDIVQTVDRSWTRSVKESGSRESAIKQRMTRGSRTGLGPFRRRLLGQLKLLMRLQPRWHDEYAGWSYSIRETILATARERGSQLLWASCSPYTLAPVAISCGRELGIPVVIDLRDPLPDYLHFPRGTGHWFYRALAQADAITAAAPCCITRELLKVRARHTNPDVVVIPSGTWAAEVVEPLRSDSFTLLHAGTLVEGGRSPQPLFEAVARLAETDKGLRQDLRMLFIGGDSAVVRDFPGYEAVRDMVEIRGQVPYSEVQQLMRMAAMLVIIKLDGDIYSDALPAKMFDYLMYRSPILSFGMEPGLQAPLLDWSNGGLWLGSVEEIAQYIAFHYRQWKSEGLSTRERRREAMQYLSQQRMAADFAGVFEALRHGRPIPQADGPPWPGGRDS
ncbi:MAG: hypothetical protein R3F46_12445 [bacterium]